MASENDEYSLRDFVFMLMGEQPIEDDDLPDLCGEGLAEWLVEYAGGDSEFDCVHFVPAADMAPFCDEWLNRRGMLAGNVADAAQAPPLQSGRPRLV